MQCLPPIMWWTKKIPPAFSSPPAPHIFRRRKNFSFFWLLLFFCYLFNMLSGYINALPYFLCCFFYAVYVVFVDCMGKSEKSFTIIYIFIWQGNIINRFGGRGWWKCNFSRHKTWKTFRPPFCGFLLSKFSPNIKTT